mgnify:CR=1 FL=1
MMQSNRRLLEQIGRNNIFAVMNGDESLHSGIKIFVTLLFKRFRKLRVPGEHKGSFPTSPSKNNKNAIMSQQKPPVRFKNQVESVIDPNANDEKQHQQQEVRSPDPPPFAGRRASNPRQKPDPPSNVTLL